MTSLTFNHPTLPVRLVEHDWTHDWPEQPEPYAHLVFADPPYNQKVKYADDPTGDRLTPSVYVQCLENWITYSSRILLPGGTFWWMCPERDADFIGPLLTRIVGPRMYRIVWHETFSQYQGDKALTMDYRFIFAHLKLGPGPKACIPRFNPIPISVPSVRQQMGDKRIKTDRQKQGRTPGCVWKIRRLQGTSTDRMDWAPTGLPPELLDRIILGWSSPGDTVVDAFLGSGSMAMQAVKHGRRFVGYDRALTYINKVLERLGA